MLKIYCNSVGDGLEKCGYFTAAIHILNYEASPRLTRRRVHSWSNGPTVNGSAG